MKSMSLKPGLMLLILTLLCCFSISALSQQPSDTVKLKEKVAQKIDVRIGVMKQNAAKLDSILKARNIKADTTKIKPQ